MNGKVAYYCSLCLLPRVVGNSIKIALVVGIILNLINQGSVLWGDASPSWPHFFMNFLVPFCVATYSAVKNEISHRKHQHEYTSQPTESP
ncbi:nitrate/nitrite transporter NrtS [Marinospirillum sp.]|uniref:nitrate/nitrite transporter NrtS n=1 Tax=Marinospirillum sp. TaxID=2183934 RepID=UPI00286FD25B|nr:nitrate/nitrite transporter NrtS [Marinospirillum sp.]MDR9468970.1 nitrate/nitrite transporter NrtS [Marinospirillum sp.]